MSLLPEKIDRYADPVANALGFKRLAKAVASGVKISTLESPFLVVGTMTIRE